MINEEETFRVMGYRSIDLKPQSNKKVCAVCDNCGKVRWVKKQAYHDLCLECSFKSDERSKKISEANKGKLLGEKHPNYGKKLPEETCKKISESCKGKRSGEKNPMYGKKHTEESRRKMSESKRGKNHSKETCRKMSESRKGAKNPNYGKNPSEETCKKISESCKGKRSGERNPMKRPDVRAKISGEKNPKWKGGISLEREIFYGSPAYGTWRTSVFERDNYTCQECGKRHGLNAHHILPYRDWKEHALLLNNGITLCEDCHRETIYNEYEYFSKYADLVLSKKVEEFNGCEC